MTANLVRAAMDLALIEASASGSRSDTVAALSAAAASLGTRYAIVDGDPVDGTAGAPEPAWYPVTVEPDRLLLLVSDPAAVAPLTAAACAARLALECQRISKVATDSEVEVEALRSVATRILRARELDEALLAVTNETLGLLDSDIAGVMLRDGDEIVMRACAGNRLADTGNLRMRKGQGLAGHVFATGHAAKVDDYLRNDVISNDFNYLARAERTRSALGAPLVVNGEVIGVLEVWRRRESTFGPGEIRRLVALADLAAIALDNARQHEISSASRRAVVVAHRALETQLGKVQHALVGQQALIEALLAGEQLPGIVRIVGERSGCDVFLLGADLEVLAAPMAAPDLPRVLEIVRTRQGAHDRRGWGTSWVAFDHRSLAIRPVRNGDDGIGWVCLLSAVAPGDEAIELAATQAALTFSLHQLEQMAAAKARASLREELLLNLLKGSPEERRAAVSRAKSLRIDLRGELRVCVCTFDGLDTDAQTSGWSTPGLEQLRRRLFHTCEDALAAAGLLRLAAANGNGVIALLHRPEEVDLHAVLEGVCNALNVQLPQTRAIWGVSAGHAGAARLDIAHAEACTAAQAVRRDSGRHVALYEELGVLALLIAGPHGTPLNQFTHDTIGPILAHDAKHGTSLLATLRAYLDLNCSQRDTAERLFVHQKTVKYRLQTIEKLTRLDLHAHGDRMRADIAIRAHDLQ